MVKCTKLFLLILSLIIISCKEINNFPNVTNQNICTDKEISTSVKVPIPITFTDKMREKAKDDIISGNLLRERMEKYHFNTLFEDDEINNNRVTFDGFGYLYYQSKENTNFIRMSISGGIGLGSGRNNNFSMNYIDYDFANHTVSDNKTILSEQEKKELITLLNIVIDDPFKSEQILSELESIYQEKLDKKEFLAQDIVVANVERQGRLFELMGIYSVDTKNPKCQENRLTSFSVT